MRLGTAVSSPIIYSSIYALISVCIHITLTHTSVCNVFGCMYDDVTHVCDDVTYVYDDVTYVYAYT